MTTKIDFSQKRPYRTTRPGTQPNTAGEKLVNVQNEEGMVERVKVSVAAERVASGKWQYCPKK